MTITQQALAKIQPPPGAPASAWAMRISACWQASVTAILEVGRLLSEAKESLPHGAFGAMIETDLPFTSRTAQMLMAISADPQISNPKFISHLPANWGALYDLSMLNLNEQQFEEGIDKGIIAPDAERKPLINGARAIMGSRQEPDDSLDYFPTPPWATRALCEHVLPRFTMCGSSSVWEPACGEGHMAAALAEYFLTVRASDVFDYGYGDVVDFLGLHGPPPSPARPDWIITNPPFNDKSEAFVLRALQFTRVGVAMFLRLQWLESIGRYERVFNPHPPALIAQFAERVPLHKGRFEPDGGTATAYLWIIWMRHRSPTDQTEFVWIAPGQREALTHPDDAERFTAHPVIRSPMTDDSTSKHSPSLEPNTTPDTQKGRPGDSQRSITPTSVEYDVSENGTPGRPSLEGEPASVVVTGVGSLSSSGVLV